MLSILVLLAVLGFLFIPIGINSLLRRRENYKKRSPLSRYLLRSPCLTLRNIYDDLIWYIGTY